MAYESTRFSGFLQVLGSIDFFNSCISLTTLKLSIFLFFLATCLSSVKSLFIFLAYLPIWMFEFFLLLGKLCTLSMDIRWQKGHCVLRHLGVGVGHLEQVPGCQRSVFDVRDINPLSVNTANILPKSTICF